MPYRIKQSDPSVQIALRRIGDEQVSRALGKVRDAERDPATVVHDVRKHCKKLRGLIRLVRPAFAAYRTENIAFRDAARDLSDVRDADVVVETFDTLLAAHQDHVAADAFSPIRTTLAGQAQRKADADLIAAKLADFAKTMRAAHERVPHWTLQAEGFDAVRDGLMLTYDRARDAMANALDDPAEENLHEWRKRVKYHWYHARLLSEIWPDGLALHTRTAKSLSDDLGYIHDLDVLADRLRVGGAELGPRVTVDTALDLVADERETVRARAFVTGGRLLAEKPKALARRWRGYWRTWD